MNNANNNTNRQSNGIENADMSPWSEEDFEEIQVETPWEIFSSEINNWSAINSYSSSL